MKISELVKKLEEIRTKEGDLEVCWQSLSHTWPPEPVVKPRIGVKVVLLNP